MRFELLARFFFLWYLEIFWEISLPLLTMLKNMIVLAVARLHCNALLPLESHYRYSKCFLARLLIFESLPLSLQLQAYLSVLI